MKNKALVLSILLAAAACSAPREPQSPAEPAADGPVFVSSAAESAPSRDNEANDPALLIDPVDPARSLILGSTGPGGIDVYRLDGTRIGDSVTRPSAFVDVRYNFTLGDEKVALVVADDIATSELVAYVWDGVNETLRQVSAPIQLEMEAEGLCLYQSPLSEKLYAFVLGFGALHQWELFDRGGQVEGRLTRTIPVGTGAAHCAVSDRQNAVYYSQETVGVATVNAEPESEAEIEYIDFSAPHGRFDGDIKGVAVFEQESGGYLLVSDADASRLQVYDLGTHEHVGTVAAEASQDVDAVEETEGLVGSSLRFGEAYTGGLVVLADDNNEAENANFKLASWTDIATALSLPAGRAHDPTRSVEAGFTTVSASAQTQPVATWGDAADDPAIWVHPTDPGKSVVIGTQKKRGINVYDMNGNLLQSREDGRVNNADVRYGFMLGGEPVDLVTASNRTHQSIGIWKVDPITRTLVDIADGIIPTGMGDPYGQCMYKSAATGDYYVYINDTDGIVKQWRLVDAGGGKVGVELAREFSVGSQTEGCVADDETGDLYVGEEEVALWKYSAEPDGGDARTMVDSVESGNITADIEGVSIYYGKDGNGYIVASNQGADNYLVYERQGDNRFLGHFHIVADEGSGIDGASETDGLDVTSANLGAAYPHGALVVQDGRNISPVEKQNYKIVPWERIAEAMGLEISSGYDPRATN